MAIRDPVEFPVAAYEPTVLYLTPFDADRMPPKRDIEAMALDLLHFLYKVVEPIVFDRMMEMAAHHFMPEPMVVKRNPRDGSAYFRVTNAKHPYYKREGEYLQSEGDTIFLWIDQKIVPCKLSDLVPVHVPASFWDIPHDAGNLGEPPF